jgi:hypothetical protein
MVVVAALVHVERAILQMAGGRALMRKTKAPPLAVALDTAAFRKSFASGSSEGAVPEQSRVR